MEDLRPLIALAFIVLLATAISPASAYRNDGPHQAINERALFEAKAMMQNDGYPAILYGNPVYGPDADGNHVQQTLQDWVVSGGYSADVPNMNSLQHGYDPSTGKGFLGFGNAVDWVSGKSSYQWSYPNARTYFIEALESDVAAEHPANPYYGEAWRSIGETMHLVADMTVPAHARVDPHPIYEPYEEMTTRKEIYAYGGGPVSGSVNYDQFRKSGKISDLMTSLATWTNDNFYSEDTIPRLTTQPDADFYYHTTIDGRDEISAKQPFRVFTYKDPNGVVHPVTSTYNLFPTVSDPVVIETQQRLLLPNAIHGDALALYEFLPKFQAVIDGVVLYPTTGKMTLFAHLNHKPTPQWSTVPEIHNGAWVQINAGTPQYIPRSQNAYPSLAKIQYPVNVLPGDKIRLIYDFGGYTITSAPYTVPAQEMPTPVITVLETPEPLETPDIYDSSTPVPMGTEDPFANQNTCKDNPDFPWCK